MPQTFAKVDNDMPIYLFSHLINMFPASVSSISRLHNITMVKIQERAFFIEFTVFRVTRQ